MSSAYVSKANGKTCVVRIHWIFALGQVKHNILKSGGCLLSYFLLLYLHNVAPTAVEVIYLMKNDRQKPQQK